VITKAIVSRIKQTDVSKNRDLTKQRTYDLWKSMSGDDRKKVSVLGISEATFRRTRSNGNINAGLAVALAQITGVDPYYLTGATNENNGSDEEKIRQFLIDCGYVKVLELLGDSDGLELAEPRQLTWLEDVRVDVKKVQPVPFMPEPNVREQKNDMMPLEVFANMQMEQLSDSERDKLFDMPDEDLMELLKMLNLQAQYSGKAKSLMGLLRLILVR